MASHASHQKELYNAPVDKTYYAELLTQLARTQSLQRKFDEAHSLLDTAREVMEGQNMPVAQIRYLLKTTDSRAEKLLAWRMDQKDDRGVFIANWTIARTYSSLDRIDEARAIQRKLLDDIERKGLDPSGYVFEELAECLLMQNHAIEAKAYFSNAYEILSKDIWLKANEGDRLERLRELGK